jgi:UDP-glucose 4-epimerase
VSLILVTGGCGFIGSHLVDALLMAGHRVRVLDDLSTGKRCNIPVDRVDLQIGDVSNPACVAKAMAGVDGCFHLAAIASVQRSVEDWVAVHRVNLTGSIAVFDAARSCGAAGKAVPVIYASSASVYGDNPNLPLQETETPRPLTAYGADKLGSELHARVAGAVHGVPSCGLRFFNVYGPRQDPTSPYSGVISIFTSKLRDGEPIAVYGDGRQTRDFIFVADVVRHLLAALAVASTDAPVLNVCTGRATSVLALARSIGTSLCHEPFIRHLPARFGDIRHSLGSPDKSRQVLGIAADIDLMSGLAALLFESV